ELLHDRIALRKECRREIQRECGVGVEIVPLDQVADRADEDRLDAPLDIADVEMVGCRRLYDLIGHGLPLDQLAFPNSIGSCRGPRTVPSDHVISPAGSSLKSGM